MVFLTTRNGIFFGLPMMIVGELALRKNRNQIWMMLLGLLLLYAEITVAGYFADPESDRSMYFCMPFFIYHFLAVLKNWNPKNNCQSLAECSVAIYVMQYGLITLFSFLLTKIIGYSTGWSNWLVLLFTVSIPCLFCIIVPSKSRLKKILF